jgi:membrane dipeptidase
MELRRIRRYAQRRIDRRELHMLDLGGVRRNDAPHCAMETLVRGQQRLDHPGAHDRRDSPRQSGRENWHHSWLSKNSALEDQTGYVSLFKECGVGVMQITYNTQNLAGAGCYERRDTGLSGFGHEVVAEMNRVGVLCDLSHVGAATSRDVILASNRPVAYTHILPAALKAHPRNKSDEEIRFIADHGGFVGVTMFPPFLARGNDATVEDYVAAIAYVIRIAGEDNVGIGTDFTQGQDDAFFEYLCHDKGYGWRVTGPLGDVVNPAGMRTIGDFPNLTAAMEHARWPEAKIRKVMGENWLRLLAEVWGE